MSLVERVRATRLPPPTQRRAIRTAVGVTLREVAAELGVGQLAVSQWERGVREPRPEHAIAYRRLLETLQELARELSDSNVQE
jgi:transcriptional regulator with XRE-family HTH domain